MAYQYGRLKRGKHAGYDQGRFNVKATKLGFLRVLLAVLVVAVLFSIQITVGILNEVDERSYYSEAEWTNNITGKSVSIPRGWIHQSQENEDGQAIDIFSGSRFDSIIVFGKEEVNPTMSLEDYVRLWRSATKENMTLSVPTRRTTVQGREGLHITGHMTDDKQQKIDAVIIKSGSHIWRVVSVGRSGRNPASEEAIKLRNALFSSIPYAVIR